MSRTKQTQRKQIGKGKTVFGYSIMKAFSPKPENKEKTEKTSKTKKTKTKAKPKTKDF